MAQGPSVDPTPEDRARAVEFLAGMFMNQGMSSDEAHDLADHSITQAGYPPQGGTEPAHSISEQAAGLGTDL